MRISFVIPARNEESGIGACIESILEEIRRTGIMAEVIVVDNASTDGTVAAAARYPVWIIHEPQKGLALARQAGLVNAHGNLVANIDADNRLPPGWLRTVFAEFDKNPRLVCLSGPFRYRHVGLLTRILVKLFYMMAWLIHNLSQLSGKGVLMVQGGNFVVRRDMMLQVGGHNTALSFYGEDTAVGLALRRVGKVKFTFRLPILSSPRRLKNEGLLRMGAKYTLNFFNLALRGKAYHPDNTDFRE